ncbi:E3 ubiquitin-protein ligase SIAH2-like [Thrips palmi]|uniref:E3 ubiquitin-protein ligase SIAH2-like n=1 Tax=Thrips palmi TaxID=161013 RepID=A0A6P9A0S9_THRPL|nr:E3 ubiquitin-protein ligase SIAH2-like [Thrips palmi]
MVEALARLLTALRKRPPPAEDRDDATAAKRAKLEHDGHGVEERVEAPQGVALSASEGLVALAQLECPVCVDTMESPVRQCVNGHCVCNACRTRVSSCPLCRGPLSFSTHAALDLLARTLRLRCVHEQCTASIKVPDRETHLLECQFNVGPCPLQPCPWTGPFQRVPGHCLEQHPLQTRTAALDDTVCLSKDCEGADLDKKGEAQSLMQFQPQPLAVLIGAEVFVLEVHVDELPGRVAVLSRQLSAGRLRPPPHCCTLTVRSKAKPQLVLSATVPVVAQEETLVPVVEAGRCLVLDWDAVTRLGAGLGAGRPGCGGGVTLECRVTLPPGPAAPGWLSWLADKFWPR